jgi:hypothetical protein
MKRYYFLFLIILLALTFESNGQQVDPYANALTLDYATSLLQTDQPGSQMGTTVSNAGDINGDGFNDVIISAPYFSHGQSHEGAVFAYYGSAPNGINPNVSTILERDVAEGHFGEYIAGGGDVNGDGYDDVLVGVPYNSGTFASTDVGSVYVYYGSAAGLSTTPAIIPSSRLGDHFGISVAIAKDIDGDGIDDILIGANNGEGYITVIYGSLWGVENSFVTEIAIAGSNGLGTKVSDAGHIKGAGTRAVMATANEGVYIFQGDAGGVQGAPSQLITPVIPGGAFGAAIAGAADFNKDGFGDIAVGDKNNNVVYVFNGSDTGLISTYSLSLHSDLDSSLFGAQLATGDINGDGYDDLLVSAPRWESRIYEINEGLIYAYFGHQQGVDSYATLAVQCDQAHAWLGSSVAGVGDVNGDNYGDILVGVQQFSNSQVYEGIGAIIPGRNYHPHLPARQANPDKK